MRGVKRNQQKQLTGVTQMANAILPSTLRAPAGQATVYVGLAAVLNALAPFDFQELEGAKYGVLVFNAEGKVTEVNSFDNASEALEVAHELSDELDAVKVSVKFRLGAGGREPSYTLQSLYDLARAYDLSLVKQDGDEYRCAPTMARVMANNPHWSRSEVIEHCESVAAYDDAESAFRTGLFYRD